MHIIAVAERAIYTSAMLIVILMAGRALGVLSDIILQKLLGFVGFCYVMHRPVANDAGDCGISVMVIRGRGIIGNNPVQSGLIRYIRPVMAVVA